MSFAAGDGITIVPSGVVVAIEAKGGGTEVGGPPRDVLRLHRRDFVVELENGDMRKRERRGVEREESVGPDQGLREEMVLVKAHGPTSCACQALFSQPRCPKRRYTESPSENRTLFLFAHAFFSQNAG